jgi:hypothetical protein
MTEVTAQRSALEVAGLFLEALNARDVDTLRSLVTDDVEFRTREGASLRGPEAVDALVRAAAHTDLLLARVGQPTIETDSGVERVSVPVREFVEKSQLHGTAVFEIRDGKVGAFSVGSSATIDRRSARSRISRA